MTIGVKRGEVLLTSYSSTWETAFEEEKSLLLEVFKTKALDIQHIGSTAIPKMKSKPLIDLAILVLSLDEIAEQCALLLNHSYLERLGRLDGKQRVFAKTIGPLVTHHLHLIELGEKDWDDKIRFRDLLRENEALRDDYSKLKEDLFTKYSKNRLAYTASKENFIVSVLGGHKLTGS